ncbi:NAD(P)H-dependent glycerol-3-phosphate dehydrogenase [Finegoldia magna]|uniref:NAD(P)H-dependent glycerol-3-phosphate dehydrogenase n=1 Tax=Finegoldia magna TaxID=1260 RepID=UPI000B91AFBF|nr:NAD(P)H-dependent glycerol-3-phosphate dehydrogenase [Finegoldia magna]MCC3309621.1 glycerol-3-phosphate dehydrogenase [Finegoldia magna]MDU2639261.1 2-dehydropantoate 2-reductase N-terminal domain-containing protein [Finegoldia magna]OXZ29063.1 glycerol-3-phosphate dehydrogenase [Finegoldia magna]OXZ35545.1 glycerol-3-phosphate dehydrogenase [Finegoldia magna]PWV48679.1 glycerol-3-phosphate dehydrogenase (NAD(P)+) [Finegoldia magna]
MKIMVIGPGRWGSFIAWYLKKIGHEVLLYGLNGTEDFENFKKSRTNGIITLQDDLELTDDITRAKECDVIHVSINAQGFRNVCEELKSIGIKDKIIVTNMKGIEISTGKRLSEVCKEIMDGSNKVAAWIGPGHPQEFYRNVPNCMVIDSEDEDVKELLIENYSSDLIRFYYGQDLIGNEIGAAYKNVIGIAAGMLDGMKISSLKGALMSRGCREVARFIKASGGKELSAYGLCHLGDYEATVFSQYSHNRMFGEMYAKSEKYDKLAEGYYTVKAIKLQADKMNLDLPINNAVYKVLYENSKCEEEIDKLFSRSLKKEFY